MTEKLESFFFLSSSFLSGVVFVFCSLGVGGGFAAQTGEHLTSNPFAGLHSAVHVALVISGGFGAGPMNPALRRSQGLKEAGRGQGPRTEGCDGTAAAPGIRVPVLLKIEARCQGLLAKPTCQLLQDG